MEGFNKNENKELEMDFSHFENKEYEALNSQIDLLLQKKFPGVEESSKDIDVPDPHYKEKHDSHMDNLMDDQSGVERKLKFKDINQKNEFTKLVEVLKRHGIDEEQKELLKEIGWGE